MPNEQAKNTKTIQLYVIGFILSLLLTLTAFYLISNKILSDFSLYFSLSSLAICQLIVQSICFLRLNNSREGRWDLFPFLFVILIAFILAGGTFWIMYNLKFNMFNF